MISASPNQCRGGDFKEESLSAGEASAEEDNASKVSAEEESAVEERGDGGQWGDGRRGRKKTGEIGTSARLMIQSLALGKPGRI
jgi:hypothetical protein